ncbi:MAG: aldehyde dehydrogenase family protein [Candidatus Obscuribacter sp.]|nr:aldehyde dehydrogenase family protein [Candidatus Obscuribacter sp.]
MVVSKTAIIESVNPSSKEVLGRAPIMTQSQVLEAVERSQKAFELWQLTSYKQRAKHLLNLRRVIAEHADQIATLISQEVGKPLAEAYLSELTGPLDTAVWLAENCEKLMVDQTVALSNPLLNSKQSLIAFEPLGVIGIIAPWNYPFSIPMMTAMMAIMLGNTVVIKPSEKSPLVGIKIGELIQEAGLPQSVVEIVTGDAETGAHLSRADIAKVIFTGSVGGGARVMAQAAEKITPVTLELGGKDAAVVLPDAPLDWTARGLTWGAFTNAGQACASVERVYIIKGKNTDKLIETIASLASKLQLGAGTDENADLGPLIDEGQLAKVKEHVQDALSKGARLITGGKSREDLGGFFFEPTVLADCNHSMLIMTEETFGPVLPIMLVDNEDQAVELANDSKYGLCATVWGGRLDRAECVARDLNVGTVLINDVLFSHATPQLPWGGVKKSGFGKGHSIFGLYDLCNIKHISIDSSGGSHRVWWYPYGKAKVTMARGGIQMLHGKITKRPEGLLNFVGNMFVDENNGTSNQSAATGATAKGADQSKQEESSQATTNAAANQDSQTGSKETP